MERRERNTYMTDRTSNLVREREKRKEREERESEGGSSKEEININRTFNQNN